jgi:hypothetical protein
MNKILIDFLKSKSDSRKQRKYVDFLYNNVQRQNLYDQLHLLDTQKVIPMSYRFYDFEKQKNAKLVMENDVRIEIKKVISKKNIRYKKKALTIILSKSINDV